MNLSHDAEEMQKQLDSVSNKSSNGQVITARTSDRDFDELVKNNLKKLKNKRD